jgi:hypothetical protein
METIYSSIEKIDIFGDGIHLKINNVEKAKTLIGASFTILIAIASIIVLIIMSMDIFKKEKPSVTLESRIVPNRPNITLDSYTFPMSFMVQDEQNNPIELSKYFTLEAVEYTVSVDENGTINSFEEYYDYVPCYPSHFPLISNDTFYSSGLNNYFCFDNQNFTISGFYDNPYMRFVMFSLKKCFNSTANSFGCASESEIIDILEHKSLSWNIYYQNTIFNTQNFAEPAIRYIVNNYRAIKNGLYKLYDIYLMNRKLISDNGIIFESIEESSIISFFEADYDFSDMTEDGYLVTIFLYSSNREEIYNRSYVKIQWVFASVGALAEIFMHLFRFISSYFSTLTMNKNIVNKIFDFDLINKNLIKTGKTFMVNESLHKIINLDNTVIKSVKKSNQTFDPKINNFLDRVMLKDKQILEDNTELQSNSDYEKSKILKIIEKYYEEGHKSNLNLSIREMFLLIFCENCLKYELKQKSDLYNKSIKILDDYLDISYIIQKLEEFEKLKLVVLTNEQLALFNFSAKDFCSLSDNKEQEKIFNRFKEFNKNSEKLSETICKFKKRYNERKDLNETDLKIYDLLREEFK